LSSNGHHYVAESCLENYSLDFHVNNQQKKEMNKESRIYVAGHRGLVGGALYRELVCEGYTNIQTKTHKSLDLTDQREVDAFFSQEKPEYVFMAAARVGGILANDTHPVEFLRDNLLMQTHVIDAAYRNNVKKFLFLGSSCIYPKNSPQPIMEDTLLSGALEPTNEWYAIAKIAGIKLCQAYRRQYGFDSISLMPTNLYGPGDNFDLESAHVMPALIRKFHDAKIKDKAEVVVWGSGKPKREFLFVDDLAHAAIFCMEVYSDEKIINIGVGKDIPILSLAELIREEVGFKGNIVLDRSKPDGVSSKLLDISHASSIGWTAQTSLKEGVQKTYQWFLENQNDFRG